MNNKNEIQELIRLIFDDSRKLSIWSTEDEYKFLKNRINIVNASINNLSENEKKEILSEKIQLSQDEYSKEEKVSCALLLQLSALSIKKFLGELSNPTESVSLSKYKDEIPSLISDIENLKNTFENYGAEKISISDMNEKIIDGIRQFKKVEFNKNKINDYEYVGLSLIDPLERDNWVGDTEHYRSSVSNSDETIYSNSLPLYKESYEKIETAKLKDYENMNKYLKEIEKEYFNIEKLPKNNPDSSFGECLKNNVKDYKLKEILEKLFDAYTNYYVIAERKDDLEFVSKLAYPILEELKQEIYNNASLDVKHEDELHAKEIQSKTNHIAIEYFENGFPSMYEFDEKLKNKDISNELKKALEKLAQAYQNIKYSDGMTMIDYYSRLEPYVNEVYEIIEKNKNISENNDLEEAKEKYRKESLFEKLKIKISEQKGKTR